MMTTIYKPVVYRRRLRRQSGFSLVEMIIAMVITGIIFALGAVLFGRSMESYALSRDSTGLAAQGRTAIERMSRELRAARTQDTTGLVTLQAADLRFIDTEGNTVRYFLSGSQLMRNDGTSTFPLADNVTALTFEYLDNAGAVLAIPPTAASVYTITAQMTVQKGDFTQTFRVSIVPRRFQ